MAALWLRGQAASGLESDAPLALAPKVEDSARAIAAPATNPNASNATTSAATTPAPSSETPATISAPPESIPLRRAESQAFAGESVTTPDPTVRTVPAETLVAANTLAGAPNAAATAAAPDEEEQEAQAEQAAEEPTPAPTSTEVVLEFTGTSWVDVRGANGRVVLNGEMRSGDRRVLDGEPPYKLVIGNTAATQLTIGGRPFRSQAPCPRQCRALLARPEFHRMIPSAGIGRSDSRPHS
jgi:cytoskeleton protein RodZ